MLAHGINMAAPWVPMVRVMTVKYSKLKKKKNERMYSHGKPMGTG